MYEVVSVWAQTLVARAGDVLIAGINLLGSVIGK